MSMWFEVNCSFNGKIGFIKKPFFLFLFPPCLPGPRPRPTAGRPRPLPRPPGRPLLHHRRQHAEPQAQIPPVQGDEEGPDNVSALLLFLLLPPDPTCLSPLMLCFPSTLFLPPSSSRPTTSLPSLPSGATGSGFALWLLFPSVIRVSTLISDLVNPALR